MQFGRVEEMDIGFVRESCCLISVVQMREDGYERTDITVSNQRSNVLFSAQ